MINSFSDMKDAITYIFQTRRRLDGSSRGYDENTRDITSTRKLLMQAGLLKKNREYVVITGSRGKGSVTSMMAKLLQSLGHQVGMMTSPHLIHWNERIRLNGAMIPTDDFLRILNELRPLIDSISQELTDKQYLSPQGIFLAMALQWFNENDVTVAVLEVGRGGRFDDIAVVPNKLSVFTPIMLEHVNLLGNTLERIAWHKVGIIKQNGFALSVPQDPEVMGVLNREVEAKNAEFTWLAKRDMAQLVREAEDGQFIELGRYGELFLPMLGRYQVENASLAIQAVGNVHARLQGIPHVSPDYVKAIREGLAQVKWLGRSQKLDSHPAIYVDGAITPESARSFLAGVKSHLQSPVVSIVGVPIDRDYAGVYRIMAEVSESLILTETDINPSTHFPAREDAILAAQAVCKDVQFADNLPQALELAKARVGVDGTILMAISLMLVGESMLIWQVNTDTI